MSLGPPLWHLVQGFLVGYVSSMSSRLHGSPMLHPSPPTGTGAGGLCFCPIPVLVREDVCGVLTKVAPLL